MEGQSYYYNNKTKNICLINKDLLGLLFKNQKIKNTSKILAKSYEDIVKSKDVPFEVINKNYYKWKVTNTDFIIITLDKSLDETLTFLKIPTNNYKATIEEVNTSNIIETCLKGLTIPFYVENNPGEYTEEFLQWAVKEIKGIINYFKDKGWNGEPHIGYVEPLYKFTFREYYLDNNYLDKGIAFELMVGIGELNDTYDDDDFISIGVFLDDKGNRKVDILLSLDAGNTYYTRKDSFKEAAGSLPKPIKDIINYHTIRDKKDLWEEIRKERK